MTIGFFRAQQRDVRREIHEHARVQLHVRIDRADFQLAVFEQLRDPQTLRAGKREVDFVRDAALE